MVLLQFSFVLLLFTNSVRCWEAAEKTVDGEGVAQYAPSELEREFPVARQDSLYAHLTDVHSEGADNGTLSRLTALPGAGSSRTQREVEPRRRKAGPASTHAKKSKTQQRYLPYSPSYGKSNPQESYLPDEMQQWTSGEKIISRQSRDTHSKSRRPKASRMAAGAEVASPVTYHPAIFAYDIASAIDSGVKATSETRRRSPPAQTNRDMDTQTTPDIMAFDIAMPDRRQAGPMQINRDQFQEAWGPAMQGAQQDFLQKVANQRPNQCVIGPDTRQNPALIWTVGKPNQNTRFAYQGEFASRRLADQFTDGNADNLFAYLDQENVDQSQLGGDDSDCYADSDVECDPDSAYRTFDGTCNNLQNPLRGSANSPQSRLGPAEYEDGISNPRRMSLASRIQNRPLLLPSAREVSNGISQNLDRESKKITYMFNQFGQFCAHDLTNTPVEKIQDPEHPGNSITPTCCGADPNCIHPACFPITVPQNDGVYGQFGINCLEFVRSQPAAKSGCRLGARIPLNSVTSYLDGSQIYGSKVSDADRLRAKKRGLLRSNDSPICLQYNLVMIPGGDNTQGCVAPSPNMKCVDAGDRRANQHTGLVSIHSLFLRVHNSIADFIATKRPHLSDETIFQWTRKIVGGIIQHIYFKEMVPIIVGNQIAREPSNGLALTKKGYCTDCYDEDLDASMQVEFAAGAYRFHTLQDNTLPVADANGVEYPFYQHFGNPAMWYKPGIIDELLRNLPNKAAEAFDPQFAFIFQNQVFKPVNKPTGIDMLAFNTQRGRDHGVPAYIKMREICGLSPVKTFRDLQHVMSKEAADNLASIYRHVRDIDFYAGGLSERSVNKEGLVGPTFACVLSDQFRKIKNGDRFWYENEGVFSPEQLKELRKVSMASILCQNSETEKIQPKAFLIPSDSNPATDCEDILARGSMKLEAFLKAIPRD